MQATDTFLGAAKMLSKSKRHRRRNGICKSTSHCLGTASSQSKALPEALVIGCFENGGGPFSEVMGLKIKVQTCGSIEEQPLYNKSLLVTFPIGTLYSHMRQRLLVFVIAKANFIRSG